jgi:hypothetical protein
MPNRQKYKNNEFIIIDCNNCSGSGEEQYITAWQNCGGAHRPFFGKRKCSKCAGLCKVKIKVDQLKTIRE